MTRPIKPRGNHDHFGVYQIGDYRTYSKLEAIEVSAKTRLELKWNFNRESFDHFDWQTEPPETLEFWYAERARQLRETYDYLVLMYSGGPDSWNVLKAFVDNNIYIDEIAHFVVEEGTACASDSVANHEIHVTAIPTVTKLIENNPTYKTTKHRIIDGGPTIIQRLQDVNKWDHWYQEGSTFFGPWATALGELRDIDSSYKDLAERKKSVCFVWGYDKPLITTNQNKFSLLFVESGMHSLVKPKYQMQNRDWQFDEAFYWTPDMPEITCKQGHIIKRFLENVDSTWVDNFYVKYYDPTADETSTYKVRYTKNNKTYELSEHGAHRLIYPGWDVNSIVCPKAPSSLFSTKDNWWYNSNANGKDWYVKGIVHLRKHIREIHPDWWWQIKPDAKTGVYRGGLTGCKITYPLN
jgi:diphthamide synthase (EF-2-diphthine--ammonia ligase)